MLLIRHRSNFFSFHSINWPNAMLLWLCVCVCVCFQTKSQKGQNVLTCRLKSAIEYSILLTIYLLSYLILYVSFVCLLVSLAIIFQCFYVDSHECELSSYSLLNELFMCIRDMYACWSQIFILSNTKWLYFLLEILFCESHHTTAPPPSSVPFLKSTFQSVNDVRSQTNIK